MSILDRIQNSFKYLDKNGLKKVLGLIKNKDVHWTGTHAEYEAQKDSIPAYAILHFTDDYDDSVGVVDKIEANNMNGVTSNAVALAVKSIGNITSDSVNSTVTVSATVKPKVAETQLLEPGVYLVRYACYVTHVNEGTAYVLLCIGPTPTISGAIGHSQAPVPNTGLHLTGTGWFTLTAASRINMFIDSTMYEAHTVTGQIQTVRIK